LLYIILYGKLDFLWFSGSSDSYLSLSQSLHNTSIISSPVIYPQTQGWQCLRFWFYSGNEYYGRSLAVSFQTDNSSTELWNYKSVNDKWTFIQLNISGDLQTLKVKMTGLVVL
jgi:hypothetical protein